LNNNELESLTHEVIKINLHLQTYKKLFSNEETVNLLNMVAPSAFSIIQESLSEKIILELSCLIDKKYFNFTTIINKIQNQESKQKLKDSFDTLLKLFKRYKGFRHEYIAHKNLQIFSKGPNNTPLIRDDIEVLIKSTNELFNDIQKQFGIIHTSFDYGVYVHGDADALINILKMNYKKIKIDQEFRLLLSPKCVNCKNHDDCLDEPSSCTKFILKMI
jgi:hypothetical protein